MADILAVARIVAELQTARDALPPMGSNPALVRSYIDRALAMLTGQPLPMTYAQAHAIIHGTAPTSAAELEAARRVVYRQPAATPAPAVFPARQSDKPAPMPATMAQACEDAGFDSSDPHLLDDIRAYDKLSKGRVGNHD